MESTQTLGEDLRDNIKTLSTAKNITKKVISEIGQNDFEVVDVKSEKYSQYKLYSFEIQWLDKSGKYHLRPINSELYIYDLDEFEQKFEKFRNHVDHLSEQGGEYQPDTRADVNSVVYTMGLSIGLGLDIMYPHRPNIPRKNIGERFEELIGSIFSALGIRSQRELKPYDDIDGPLDFVISPHALVRSSEAGIDTDEVVVSAKTSTKERIQNIHKAKKELDENIEGKSSWIVCGIHDIQRNGQSISKTISSDSFISNQKKTPLDGLYYADPPMDYSHDRFNDAIKTWEDLIYEDLWVLL